MKPLLLVFFADFGRHPGGDEKTMPEICNHSIVGAQCPPALGQDVLSRIKPALRLADTHFQCLR